MVFRSTSRNGDPLPELDVGLENLAVGVACVI